MTTATGEVAVNYAALGDVNPYTNGSFTYIGTGQLKIVSGTALYASGSSPVAHRYNGSMGSGTVAAKVEIGTGFAGGDDVAAAVLDASGNGYAFKVTSSVTGSLQILTALAAGGLVNTSLVATSGDVFELRWATNGDLRVYKNGVIDTNFNATDTTFTSGLSFAFLTSADNFGTATALSFAGDGIVAGGSSLLSKMRRYM